MKTMWNRAAMAACMMILAGASGLAQARDDDSVDKRVDADPAGEVLISNVSGSLRVVGWDKPVVHVTGTIGSGVERLDVIREGKRVMVKVVLPRSGSGRGGSADLEIHAPGGSTLEVTTVSADIETRGITGPMRLKTVSGNIDAAGVGGDTEMKSVSGDQRLAGGAKPIDVRSTSVSGNVTIVDVSGSLEAVTVSGDLILDLGTISNARVRTTSGGVRLDAKFTKDGRLEMETVSGDLSVSAGGEAGFQAEAESFSGDITTCFGARAEPTSKYGPGERLAVTRGAGGAKLRIRTMSGDLKLCD